MRKRFGCSHPKRMKGCSRRSKRGGKQTSHEQMAGGCESRLHHRTRNPETGRHRLLIACGGDGPKYTRLALPRSGVVASTRITNQLMPKDSSGTNWTTRDSLAQGYRRRNDPMEI